MKTKQTFVNLKKQAGMTLMEIIAALAIIAVVVVGALSLFNSASSSQNSTQVLKDLTAMRVAAQQMYLGTGSYGVSQAMNPALIVAGKVPSTMTVNTPAAGQISTLLGGQLTLTSTAAANNFTMTLTNVPVDVCVALLTNASTGWSSVKAGANPAITTFPVSPSVATNAAQGCVAGTQSIVWTTIN